MNRIKNRERIFKMVGIAMLSAIVVILQLLGSFIKFGPFSISLVLVPIVVGAGVYGLGAGTWLGFVFAITVLLSGDAATFLAINPAGAVITVIAKGVLAGLAVDIVYGGLQKYNKYLAIILSAVICPIVNTGIFLLGCKIFFMGTITEWASDWSAQQSGVTKILAYFIFGLVGGNFIFELLANIVMCPVILKLVNIGYSKIKLK